MQKRTKKLSSQPFEDAGPQEVANSGGKEKPPAPKKSVREIVQVEAVDASMEKEVGVTVDDLTALYVLDSLKGFGPQKFKEVHMHGLKASAVIDKPELLPTSGKRGDLLRAALKRDCSKVEPVCRQRAVTQIRAAHKYGCCIATYQSPFYPPNVFESNYPAPFLYIRGAPPVLKVPEAVACVGSRRIRPPYVELETAFVKVACQLAYTVVAGFALGADTVGHKEALALGGKTICVMAGGLDRPFPPENKSLWEDLLRYPGAAFVSELGFGARASALTLRKRNKLIVAFARGALIAQSALDGGAMNAYRFALEQHKPVATFRADDSDDTSGNRLISERYPNSTFNGRTPQADTYERWLRQLSSSTATEHSGTAIRPMHK